MGHHLVPTLQTLQSAGRPPSVLNTSGTEEDRARAADSGRCRRATSEGRGGAKRRSGEGGAKAGRRSLAVVLFHAGREEIPGEIRGENRESWENGGKTLGKMVGKPCAMEHKSLPGDQQTPELHEKNMGKSMESFPVN